jgi:hypothetical protein
MCCVAPAPGFTLAKYAWIWEKHSLEISIFHKVLMFFFTCRRMGFYVNLRTVFCLFFILKKEKDEIEVLLLTLEKVFFFLKSITCFFFYVHVPTNCWIYRQLAQSHTALLNANRKFLLKVWISTKKIPQLGKFSNHSGVTYSFLYCSGNGFLSFAKTLIDWWTALVFFLEIYFSEYPRRT